MKAIHFLISDEEMKELKIKCLKEYTTVTLVLRRYIESFLKEK